MNDIQNSRGDLPLSAALGAREIGRRNDLDTTFDDPMPAAVGSLVRLGEGTKVTEVNQETTDDD